MKNQNVLRILALVFAIAMMLTIASCDLFNKQPAETTPQETTEVTTPEPTTPAHVHTEEVVPGKDATCTEAGKTDGKKCSECGEIIVAQEEIPALGHTEVAIEAVAATCTEAGKTAGKKCSVCNEVLEAPQDVAALGHTPGAAATCETAQTCTVCNVELAAALGHTYGNLVTTVVAPTCTEKGAGTYKCINCDGTKDVIITPRHNIVDGKCADCALVITKVEDVSYFDVDGDGNPEVYYFTNALPSKFAGEGVYHIDAVEDMLPSSVRGTNHTWYDEVKNTNKENPMPFPHVYCDDTNPDQSTQYLEYQVYVDKAGVYEMVIHLRLKRSDNYRGAVYTINRGTADEYKFSTTYNLTAAESTTATDNDLNLSTYMVGIKLTLKAGMNTIRIQNTDASVTKKAQHFRNFYFIYDKCANEGHVYGNVVNTVVAPTCTEKGAGTYKCINCDATKDVIITPRHNIVDGKCADCALVITKVEDVSYFDVDGDGNPEVYYFTNALPTKFAGEGVYHIDAVEDMLPSSVRGTNHTWYDEVKNTNKENPMPFPHVYCDDTNPDQSTQYLDYQVYVDKAGVYEMVIHLRLKRSDNYRGAVYTINRGTADEYKFSTTYNLTAAESTTATDNDLNLSTYMVGIKLTLKAGMNTIRIQNTDASVTKKAQHFRNFYFIKYTCEDGHTYGNTVTTVVAPTCTEKGTGTYACVDCGATKDVILVPRHNIVDGKCADCALVITKVEDISYYDVDGDGNNEVYYFTNALPTKFAGEGVYHIDAVEDMLPSSVRGTNHTWYDEVKNTNKENPMPFPHVYCDDTNPDQNTQYLDYQVYVDEAGVYDMVIHLRLKRSANYRGAVYTINAGTADEYTFSTTYNLTAEESTTATDNDLNLSTYMVGIKLTLKAGMNTIHIKNAPTSVTPKAQHFRNFFFVYNKCDSVGHTWVNGECTVCDVVCGEHTYITRPESYTPATCLEEGNKTYACTNCGFEKVDTIKALGHTAGEDGVCTTCEAYKKYEIVWNDDLAAKVNTQNPPTSFYSCPGWTTSDWIDRDSLPEGSMLYVKASVWIYPEMLVDKNKNNARPSRFAGPVVKNLDDSFWGAHTTISILGASGIKSSVEIWVPVEGATVETHRHTYKVVETTVPGCFTAGQWDLTCSCGDTKIEQVNALGHTHPDFSKSDKCLVCGEFCSYPVINTFDYEINYLAPVLPEKFDNTISVVAMDAINNPNNKRGDDFIYYDEVVNTSGGNRFANPDPFISVYIAGNDGAAIEFVVNVPETGVYEFAIHTRMSSSTQRGFKITTNVGTPNETVNNFDFKLTAISTDSVKDHDNTKSAYLYGSSYKLNLVAGPNTVTFSQITDEVWTAGTGSNNIYIRQIYFKKVADFTAAHEHTWSDTVLDEKAATCTTDGYKNYKCTGCIAVKSEVVKATGHKKGDLILSNDPTCISQRENFYDCTACDDVIVELNATGENARLNHSLDADNKCTKCQQQFKVLDLGWTAGKYWDNQDIYALYTMKEDAALASTKVFTLNEIPIGAIITVKAGYDGKIDGWDQYRRDLDNANPPREGRDGISTFAARNYWADKGADFTTQLDPTLGTRYRYFYFTVKREDGKPITAEELAEALVVLVPAN